MLIQAPHREGSEHFLDHLEVEDIDVVVSPIVKFSISMDAVELVDITRKRKLKILLNANPFQNVARIFSQ